MCINKNNVDSVSLPLSGWIRNSQKSDPFNSITIMTCFKRDACQYCLALPKVVDGSDCIENCFKGLLIPPYLPFIAATPNRNLKGFPRAQRCALNRALHKLFEVLPALARRYSYTSPVLIDFYPQITLMVYNLISEFIIRMWINVKTSLVVCVLMIQKYKRR